MGIIKSIASAVSGNLADQWLEVLEADNMDGTTVFTKGVAVRRDRRNNNNRRDYCSNYNRGYNRGYNRSYNRGNN